MDSGTTEQTIYYLKGKPISNILVLTLITALSSGVYTRIKSDDLQIEHYDIDF